MFGGWAALASGDILHHISDSNEIEVFRWTVHLPDGSPFYITKHVVFLWVAAALTILLCLSACRDRRLVPGRLRSFFEAILLFLRDELVTPYMGKEGAHYLPYVWTVFFFILFCNLLGIVPQAATATGNILVTGALALVSLAVIQATALLKHGPIGYFKVIVPQVPLFLWPLMLVIELAGFVAKTVALTIRLFANMVAGHVVILAILGFILLFPNNVFVALVSVAGAAAIFFLEIFVAFLQAFVFTFLTVVFIGEVLHPHH
ncbi:MAG: F0F1 ATP synthase subunit A [Planctomycetes bacterium]|nr:F0F1 ATP synthase subunit A [Planctomycetota bacterium]